MAKIVHFEIPVDDPQRAAEFYSSTLGWEISQWGEEKYWLVRAGAEDESGADGALVGREDLHRSPVVVAGVADIDDVLKRAESGGGQVLQAKLPIPGMGWSAYLRDSEGNTIGLFQVDANAPSQ